MRLTRNKKGISVWISYVILIALVVSIGFFMLRWTRGHTEDTVQDIVERGDALTTCNLAGIDVKNLCQNTQTLNMDVTNTNDIRLEGLWVRMFDIYNRPQISSRNTTIKPQKTKAVKVLKQGIIKQADIIPIVKKDGKRILCESRKLQFSDIKICS